MAAPPTDSESTASTQGACHRRLVRAVNDAWTSRYGGEAVEDEAALVLRIEKLAEDRDCWLANARANQKEYQKLERRLSAND